MEQAMDLAAALESALTNRGVSLADLSRIAPTLTLFLRHLGCTFCREALEDLSLRREAVEASGAQIALVHMEADGVAGRWFERYRLADIPRVSDPDKKLYRALGLRRGGASRVLGPAEIWRTTLRLLSGKGLALPAADPFQMPGVFLFKDGELMGEYRHRRVSDRPDYQALADCKGC
jgi:peroxiredoxin